MTRGRGRRVFDMGRQPIDTGLSFPNHAVVPPLFMNLRQPLTGEGISALLGAMRGSFPDMMALINRIAQQDVERAEVEMRTEYTLHERGSREMANAPTKNILQLETGEQRETNRASRVFFVYVTPTGAEMPISKCPGLKKEWGRTNGAFGGESRQTITEYTVTMPCTIKLVNLQSTFGRPKRVVNLMIDLNPEAAVIELKGLDGFGLFKGRAKVRVEQSTFFVNRENTKLTDTVLKEHFGLRVLQPPIKGGGEKKVRSLIFE